MGPSIKYVTLFWTNFDTPFSLSDFVTHLKTPLKYVTHLVPPIFGSTRIHTYVFTVAFVLVREGCCSGSFVQGFLSRRFCPGVVFVRSAFCHNTCASVTTEN